MENNFLEINALKVSQPLGDFFIVSIPANKLIEICFSEPLKYIDDSGRVQGSQRVKDEKRLKEIGKYIESVEMAFPNSIIISANYNENGQIISDNKDRWKIINNNDSNYKLIIPTNQKLAAVIDGQHRLSAFRYVDDLEKLGKIDLVCSIYFDLPNSYQAFLFATINSNQKKVDRSLALEQFGYNVDDESEKAWTPEKFAVFLSRKLNTDKLISPFYGHIKVAPQNFEILFNEDQKNKWVISTATIVDGITSLISTNPKRDRILMQQKSLLSGRNRSMIESLKDTSPLRKHFLNFKDQQIYDIITHYFNDVREILWNNSNDNSYIKKTVGVQALFDVLKNILKTENDVDNINFFKYISQLQGIDFGDKFFQSSGIGRSRIRNTINLRLKLLSFDRIKSTDKIYYSTVLNNTNTNYEPEKWYCEEEAENAIINALENINWNYKNNTVSLILDNDLDNIITISNYEELLIKLEQIGEIEFYANAPSDKDLLDLLREKFNIEEIIQSSLIPYNENLKKIRWL